MVKNLNYREFKKGVRAKSTPEDSDSDAQEDSSIDENGNPSHRRQLNANLAAELPLPRRRRKKPMKRVLREIVKLQKSTKLAIPKAPFSRLVKEIMHNNQRSMLRSTSKAIESQQESAECFIVGKFEIGTAVAAHAGRKTLKESDLQLIEKIRKS